MLDVGAMEVLERTAGSRAALTLVPRTVFCAAVGVLGRTGQSEEAELANPHAGPELDRQGGDVRQLKRHVTAGFIDPGFSGQVTLELSNVATLPIKVWPGMKVGQLCFFRLSSPSESPYGSAKYGSRYQGQRGPYFALP